MAIFRGGPAATTISGSVADIVFSRNRGGQYMRRRAMPSTVTSTYALQIKAILAAQSQNFRDLSTAQQAAWQAYAQQNPVLNALGAAFTKSGHQAYIAINSRLSLVSQALLTAPPIAAAPDALLTYTQNGDLGAGAFTAVYTATPLGATSRLWTRACAVNSPAINYVSNLLRFVGISAAAQASPFDDQTPMVTRLGTLVAGQTLHVRRHVFDTATGLLSPALPARVLLTST